MVLKREQLDLKRIAPRNFGTKEWYTLFISLLLISDLAILLDIPYLRQIVGFLFLTLLPGLLIIQILKLNKIEPLEKFILAWGLGIAFLMLFGLLINNLLLSLGYETPLSAIPLLISFNIAYIVLAILGHRINKSPTYTIPYLNLSTLEKAFLIVPILFPALSIFGMHVMNTTDNNIILLFLLFLIPTYVIFVCIFNSKFPKRLYPVVIFLISISLLLLLSLRSNHIIGMDVHTEYYFFQTTLGKLHWAVFEHSVVDACLVITLLPTIYQSILDIPSEFLFKILYPLLYSVSPLVIYVISKKYIEEGYAFLASCFFMFQFNFLFTAYNARTNIAIFFFALAMMTLFIDKMDPLKKRVLLIVFMASCMVSHYSTTYIFFFILVGTVIGIEILSIKYTVKKVVSLTITILFFSMIFFWYSQVTEAAFNSGVCFIEDTLTNLNEFFVVESRGDTAQALIGGDIIQKGISHKIEFVFTWLTFVFIAIGVVTLIIRYKEMSFPELEFKKLDFLREKFEVGYFVIALISTVLLVSMIALPYLSKGYNLDRLYAVGITPLSVFFVVGGIILSKHFFFFKKRKPVLKEKQKSSTLNTSEVWAYLIILLVLIPYFFSVTGVTYQVFGVPRSIILNSEGEQYDVMYIPDQDSYAAKWLATNYDRRQRIYTADKTGSTRLRSQAMIRRALLLATYTPKKGQGYIYLRSYNAVAGLTLGKKYPIEMTEYSDIFVEKNKIYDNDAEIYR